MNIKVTKAKPGSAGIMDERRTGINRRTLIYDWYIPERRTGEDRRQDGKYTNGNHGEWRDRRRCA